MKSLTWQTALFILAGWPLFGLFDRVAEAGGPPFRRSSPAPVVMAPQPTVTYTAVRETNPSANDNAPTPMLGSFYATPVANVRGNNPTGGGYSPLGQYGMSNLAIYGPLSIYRPMAAEIPVYRRGYDGAVVQTEATVFTTPNLPQASPVVYPTPATYRDRPRPYRLRTSWPSAINWLDQN